MKTKDEASNWFRVFKAQVENQIDKKIKVLRLNNGDEYTSNDFKNFCKDAGIKKDTIVSSNPLTRMGVQRERNGPSLILSMQWYISRICLCFFGQKHVTLRYLCQTGVLTRYWGTKLLRKLSQGWSQR